MPRNECLRQHRVARNWRQHRVARNWRQQEVADQLGVTLVTVQRWERGFQRPSAYHRIKLSTLFSLSVQELGLLETPSLSASPESKASNPDTQVEEQKPLDSPSASPESESCNARPPDAMLSTQDAIWMVPYARNPHFTGRDDLFAQLTHQFSSQEAGQPASIRRAALTQSYAIKGLGGVGKTQIAVEYAYRSLEQGHYTHTIWIDAASEETILTSFATLASLLLSFASTSETDQRKLVAALIRWLEQCTQPWLLIVDNVDDPSLIPAYLPSRGNGHILFTTRASAVGSLASSIEVDCMGLMEGTQLLLRRAQREALATDAEIDEATNIAVALAQFPLAIDQAGAYIEETGCSLHDYLQLYNKHQYLLLAHRGKQAWSYPKPVATTWSLSFQRVEQTNPAAAELLHLCAFLAPDHIPLELLVEGAAHWPPVLRQAVADPLVFNQMLETLLAFSLVKRLAKDKQLRIHRLVQVVQMEHLSAEEKRQWAERVVLAVNSIFPQNPLHDVTSWPQCLRYLEQVQACDALIQQYQLLLSEAADVLNRTGIYLSECALYTLAEHLYQQALTIREKTLGPEHPDVAHPLNGLANLYCEQGKYTEAESLYLQSLQISEQHSGSDHFQTAISLDGLAFLSYKQGKYTKAEPLYLRAVQIKEQHLGPEHADIAASLNGLARLYHTQGKYVEAEPLYLRALRICEQHLGPEHPDVARPLNNLAYLYHEQGKHAEAESLYLRALRICEQYLRREHPLMAYILNNLANIYRDQGKHVEAESLYLRALRIREQCLGPEHPNLAYPLSNLANIYRKQGKHAEAELLYLRALRICEQHLEPEHPDVAYPLHSLAILYHEQGKYAEAEPLYLQSLVIRERQFGPEHLDVALRLTGLANLYRDQGKHAEAEPLCQRALAIREKVLGLEHPYTAQSLDSLALLYHDQGKHEHAALLYQRALAIREKQLGPEHPDTAKTRMPLIALLRVLGRYEEAAQLEATQSEQRTRNS